MGQAYIKYTSGYKYQMEEDYHHDLATIAPDEKIVTDYIELDTDGHLLIKKGYAWDGPSGPTFDTLNFMRGSLVHDALYQLMRLEHLDKDACREAADKELRAICRADGMSAVRAWYVYWAVRLFGKIAADEEFEREVITAPRPQPE